MCILFRSIESRPAISWNHEPLRWNNPRRDYRMRFLSLKWPEPHSWSLHFQALQAGLLTQRVAKVAQEGRVEPSSLVEI